MRSKAVNTPEAALCMHGQQVAHRATSATQTAVDVSSHTYSIAGLAAHKCSSAVFLGGGQLSLAQQRSHTGQLGGHLGTPAVAAHAAGLFVRTLPALFAAHRELVGRTVLAAQALAVDCLVSVPLLAPPQELLEVLLAVVAVVAVAVVLAVIDAQLVQVMVLAASPVHGPSLAAGWRRMAPADILFGAATYMHTYTYIHIVRLQLSMDHK